MQRQRRGNRGPICPDPTCTSPRSLWEALEHGSPQTNQRRDEIQSFKAPVTSHKEKHVAGIATPPRFLWNVERTDADDFTHEDSCAKRWATALRSVRLRRGTPNRVSRMILKHHAWRPQRCCSWAHTQHHALRFGEGIPRWASRRTVPLPASFVQTGSFLNTVELDGSMSIGFSEHTLPVPPAPPLHLQRSALDLLYDGDDQSVGHVRLDGTTLHLTLATDFLPSSPSLQA